MITIISDDEEDSMELDGFVADKCVSCNGGDGDGMKLVACSGAGCLLAKHEECMCRKTEVYENGRWLCRYCSYKRAVVRAERLRRKALRAKEPASALNANQTVTVVPESGGKKLWEKDIGSSSSELEPNAKCAASSKLVDIPELNQSEKVTTSCFDLNKVAEFGHNEKATEVLAESRKVPEKTTSSREPRKVPDFSEELLYRIRKRRRINWTADELKLLREGVLYYSPKVNQNVPWRKILGLGRHIFHNTRTPVDLKDKWKVLCKEVSLRKRRQAPV